MKKIFKTYIFEVSFSISDSSFNQCDIFLHRVPYLPDDLKPKSSSNDDDPFADETDDDWGENDDFYDKSDPLAALYPNFLCPIFNELQTVCLEDSILELFAKNGKIVEDDIASISDDEIIDIVNTKNIRYTSKIFSVISFWFFNKIVTSLIKAKYLSFSNSEIFSVAKDFRSMLGDVKYNETGMLIHQKETLSSIYMNFGFEY